MTLIFVIKFSGGSSFGCPENAGGAGTFYDAVPRSLIVSNHNKSTVTDTLLMEFPNQPLWTNVYVRNNAKASVPLLWSRVQVSWFKVDEYLDHIIVDCKWACGQH